MIQYSLGVIAGYAGAKWVTPRCLSLKTKKLHIHHWMWATVLLAVMIYVEPDEVVIGALTGVALQGLSYKNWGMKRGDDK